MTMIPIELPRAASMQSTLARIFQSVANWHERRHHRAAARLDLKNVPDHLRHDLGLDGGAPMRPARGNGRSFDHNLPQDELPRNWGW